MNERLDSQLRHLYASFTCGHDHLRANMMASLPEREPAPAPVGWARRGWQWIGETKMRRRLFGTTAVAASLVLAMITLWPGGGGRVYGMVDAVNLIRNAEVIHAKGWIYVPLTVKAGQERTRCPLEFWVDRQNARQRRRTANSCFTHDKGTYVCLAESVSDGQFVMEVNHTDKSVEYSRLNPFSMKLQSRMAIDEMIKQWFGDPEQLEGFKKIKQEPIGTEAFDVWLGETSIDPGGNMKMRIQCWIAPKSGEIGKLKYWVHCPGAAEDWSLVLDIETIERNVPVAPGTFDTNPPKDYTLKNTKETATVPELTAGGVGCDGLQFSKHIEFSLKDGGILIGWSSTDTKAEGPQDALFSGLEFGGALPRLPIELRDLGPVQAGTDLTLEGYHLAHTKKQGRFYEWSLYVADRPSPDRRPPRPYPASLRFNPVGRKERCSLQIMVNSDSIRIRNQDDFDALVRGAMAELSDDGQAPDQVTYEKVMALGRRLQAAVATQPANTSRAPANARAATNAN